MLKKNILLISIIYTAILVVLCLIKINVPPKISISVSDKTFHFLAYAVLSLLWYLVVLNHFKVNKIKAIIYTASFSIVFGIIVEVLQGTLTTYRSADVLDVIANSIGVLITVILILIYNLITIKKQ